MSSNNRHIPQVIDGFDRRVPLVEYWQDFAARNPGSTP
jgi:hypothetical protein